MRSLPAVLALVAVALSGGGAAPAAVGTQLSASGPVSVSGTEASGVFTVADRTVRQVRYADRGLLHYRFRLVNESAHPVRVTGLADGQVDPRLFDLVDATAGTVPAGGSAPITLSLEMNGCESLSSRSGSFLGEVVLAVEERAGAPATVTISLPEELHTGSPREASCPGATATSRPVG